MSSPKKKLPTGPIRIEPPTYTSKEGLPESSSQETRSLESSFLKSGSRYSSLSEIEAPGSPKESVPDEQHQEDLIINKQDSGKQDVLMPEKSKQGSTFESASAKELKAQEASKQETSLENLDSIKQESAIRQTEYKKVAMRLSETAVERLRSFRANTGLPYEILVDVMICNWDNLPDDLKHDYVMQVKQLRLQRLVAGQNKGLETAMQKLTALE